MKSKNKSVCVHMYQKSRGQSKLPHTVPLLWLMQTKEEHLEFGTVSYQYSFVELVRAENNLKLLAKKLD